MRQKKTRMGALLNNRCPKCYEGKLFCSSAYNLKRLSDMPPACPVCGEDFGREPGFYFGAAYVSYALTVALWVALFVALTCLDQWGWITFTFFEDVSFFLTTGIVLVVLLMPILMRLSRSIWLHMFTRKT
jgi:uncharacterized protein (DUF983 family)